MKSYDLFSRLQVSIGDFFLSVAREGAQEDERKQVNYFHGNVDLNKREMQAQK